MDNNVNRRCFLKALGLAPAVFPMTRCMNGSRYSTGNAPGKKPNILFLFTDDQRFDTIRALGNSRGQKPRPGHARPEA